MKTIIAFLIGLCVSIGMSARSFTHPGILHTQESLDRMARLVKDEVWPAMGSYRLLKSEPEASSAYVMKGPFRYISRAGKYGYTKAPCEDDFNAAYYNALLWSITSDHRHADKAMEIIRAYASTLLEVCPGDAPLCAGLQGFILVNAAEIMRYTYPAAGGFSGGWSEEDTRRMERMLRGAFLPVLKEFYETCGFPYVSTHPMFGPTFANLDNLSKENAIIISEGDHLGKIFFKDLYSRLHLNIREYTFKEHDEVVAYSLGIPFASTMVFAATMKHQDAPGTTFKRHMKTARGLLSEDDYLLTEILLNPHVPHQIERIQEELSILLQDIRNKDTDGIKQYLTKIRKNIE